MAHYVPFGAGYTSSGAPQNHQRHKKRLHLSVDGSFVEANAAKESRIPREQLREAAQVHQTVRRETGMKSGEMDCRC